VDVELRLFSWIVRFMPQRVQTRQKFKNLHSRETIHNIPQWRINNYVTLSLRTTAVLDFVHWPEIKILRGKTFRKLDLFPSWDEWRETHGLLGTLRRATPSSGSFRFYALLSRCQNSPVPQSKSAVMTHITFKHSPWPILRKRTIPTERPPLVGEI
jgi:hypothetical protein